MNLIIANIINLVANLFILLVIVNSLISYFLDPYHPLRMAIDRILNPFLAPIRRIVPLVGMLDLSPMILIILVIILTRILVSLVSAL